MRGRRWIMIAACAVSACASPPHRPTPGGLGGSGGGNSELRFARPDALMFSGFDADGDLAVTLQETAAGAAREFERADTSHDRILTPIEYENWANAALGGDAAPRRLDLDRNVDGKITREEFLKEIQARAQDYDKNKDGKVLRSELVQTRSAPRQVGPSGPPPPGSVRPPEEERGS